MKENKAEVLKGNESKREKLLKTEKKFPFVKIIVILLAVTIPLAWFILRSGSEAGAVSATGTQVTQKVNYSGQNIRMTTVDAVSGSGSIEIPADIVKDKKIVYFEYSKGGKKAPLMAYITPSGKLVTAISMCEPCRSTKFHIEGDEMVCNACGTRWTLEKLQGVSGGCLAYPPDVVAHTLEGGKVKIQDTIILGWKPRV
ncbi:MAG: DUF2318 domain-containing protein [Syntrophales bacterium]|jgi:uncharacterized membrane protein|nr:DUF2318 domain-containing protein [Syntrophales bacterium]